MSPKRTANSSFSFCELPCQFSVHHFATLLMLSNASWAVASTVMSIVLSCSFIFQVIYVQPLISFLFLFLVSPWRWVDLCQWLLSRSDYYLYNDSIPPCRPRNTHIQEPNPDG